MSKSLTLIDCLKAFNRGERYWLSKNALGKGNDLELYLDMGFRDKVLKKAKIPGPYPSPEKIWWATEYKFNWLAGALMCYRQGELGLESIDNNILNEPNSDTQKQYILDPAQEDADLVISFKASDESSEKYHIIIIEAKVCGPWNSKQFISKYERIQTLKDLIKERKINVHIAFLLASRKEPELLMEKVNNRLNEEKKQPINDSLAHVVLDVDDNLKKITRFNDTKMWKTEQMWKTEPAK